MEHTVRFLAPVDVIYDDELRQVLRVVVLDTEATPDSGNDLDLIEAVNNVTRGWPAWEMGY